MKKNEAKRVLKLKAEGILWCVKHPIVFAVTRFPSEVIQNNPRLERIAERWFDKPDCYIPKHKVISAIKVII